MALYFGGVGWGFQSPNLRFFQKNKSCEWSFVPWGPKVNCWCTIVIFHDFSHNTILFALTHVQAKNLFAMVMKERKQTGVIHLLIDD